MNPFITFREKDNDGNLQYYVLQRGFPHYVGKISPYPIENPICQVALPGYNLWVVFDGVLRGNFAPSFPNELKNMQIVFENMAVWFHSERVVMSEKRYKKFKIVSNAAISN